MKNIKHNKIKNTGILFELLLRQITADILNDNKNAFAAKLVKKYFSSSKPLGKEIQLYNMVLNESFTSEAQANRFLDEVLKSRTKISNASLRREKYNLIKEIREKYPTEDFFRSQINNYKVRASIYGLFLTESSKDDFYPTDIVRHRNTLVEHILKDRTKQRKIQEQKSKEIAAYEKKDKDLRLLSYKILVDNFNSRYKNLNTIQKKLLKEYINNISNTNSLREFLNEEASKVKKILKALIPTINDKVSKIKVNEAYKQVNALVGTKNKGVKDKNVLTLMRYYELVKELRHVTKKIKKKVI
tara:strand:- start:35 stop:937 length:903 start_codon:yes stop_codon:yes gene_type:complete